MLYFVCTQDKKPMPGTKQLLEKKWPAQKRKFAEDSSDESESELQLSPQKTRSDSPSDSDENMESTPVKSKPGSVEKKFPSSSTTPKPTSVTGRLSSLSAKVAVVSDEPYFVLSPEKVSHC